MRYSLDDIYNQASQDNLRVNLDGKGYTSFMVLGVKIIKDNETGKIQILNTMVGGDYYSNLSEKELNIFYNNGWRYGVFVLSLSNLRTKLNVIEKKIQNELTARKSIKQLRLLKNKRQEILSKYSELNYKLNQLK